MNVPFMDDRLREIVLAALRRELRPGDAVPEDRTDLVETRLLDSMAWVSFVRAVESATGVHDLGERLGDRPASIASVVGALMEAQPTREQASQPSLGEPTARVTSIVFWAGFGEAVGARIVPSEEIDREYGMASGKLRKRAGIESVARVGEGETEVTLGAKAAQQAVAAAGIGASEADWVLATSETQVGYPSLAALLHSRLLLRETCGALDVGGACLGLVNALVVAQSLIATGQAKTILVVTADVHSRLLAPGRVPGEFGGLFGDGASAFVLRSEASEGAGAHRLGAFHFGCAGHFAAAIRVGTKPDGRIDLYFDGEALSRAAVSRLEQVLTEVELRSGIPRSEVAAFATHQPNPRLVELLARQLGVPAEKFPAVARTSGNLGSSTCGLALARALGEQMKLPADKRQPIFLASLGPGLLWGGGWLAPVRR
jgi:3-oxoacyl-[acyl-carrier-protein] synthase-3